MEVRLETTSPHRARDVVAVMIGAARFPRSPALDSDQLAEAFTRSKRDVGQILSSFCSEILDRFDSKLAPADLCDEIDAFLRERPAATDLVVYYVGHGGFLEDQSYFLSLRETTADREQTTGLRAADLTNTLNRRFRLKRTFVILDCCFAGSVLPLLQGPLQDLIEQQSAMGVALLSASSRSRAAIVPPGAKRTMFSDCLCDVLANGIPDRPRFLSLRDIHARVVHRIAQKYPNETKAWPEVHTPRQQGADIANLPLFPNAWRDTAAVDGTVSSLITEQGDVQPIAPVLVTAHSGIVTDEADGPTTVDDSADGNRETVRPGRAVASSGIAENTAGQAVRPTELKPDPMSEIGARGMPVSLTSSVAFFVSALALTSLLAILGTFLSASKYILYWPAFVVVSIAAVYFRWWGLALAALSQVPMNLLLNDAPLRVGVPVSVIQIGLVLVAFRVLKIDPALRSWRDRARYIVFGAALPSALGSTLSAGLSTLLNREHFVSRDWPTVLADTGKWTAENTIPAIVPGIWLFGLIADSYRPFAWRSGRRPVSWMRRSFTASAPWLLSLLCIGTMFMFVVLDARVAPGWSDLELTFARVPELRWMSLGLSICILYAVGSAIQQSKQAWALTEAIRRYFPNRQLSELLTSGMAAPTEQRLVTVLVSEIHGFAEESGKWSPAALVVWLNDYFASMCCVCDRYGGAIDKFVGSKLSVIFGLQSDDGNALEAMRCAVDMLDELARPDVATRSAMPNIRIGIGVCTGVVVAGEIGAPNRKQYTVIGEAANSAEALRNTTPGLGSELCGLLLAEDTVRRAGLLAHSEQGVLLTPIIGSVSGVRGQSTAYGVHIAGLPDLRRTLASLAARNSPFRGAGCRT